MYHILVIDDAVVSLNAIKKCLQDTYKLTLVRTGREAVAVLQKSTVDIILMDYDMPEMDGVETLKRIRKLKNGKDVPVFVLTGHSDRQTVMKCIGAGVVGYLVKPLRKENLEQRIYEYFRMKDSPQDFENEEKDSFEFDDFTPI